MDFDFIENLTEEQIINIYQNVIEYENNDYLSEGYIRCCTMPEYPYPWSDGSVCCRTPDGQDCMGAMYCAK